MKEKICYRIERDPQLGAGEAGVYERRSAIELKVLNSLAIANKVSTMKICYRIESYLFLHFFEGF